LGDGFRSLRSLPFSFSFIFFTPCMSRGNSYLKVVQKIPKCDVTLLSIYNSDWSQKGKFNSCNIITLDA